MSFRDHEPDIQDTVNKISLAAAVIVFLTWSIIGLLKSKHVNRVTLRFQTIIAFIDILRHCSNYNIRANSETLCSIIGASINFSDNIYVAFNTLLAINAWLVFISRQRPKITFYRLYAEFMVSYCALLTICYYTNGAYGRNSFGDCNFKIRDDRIVSRFYMMYLMQLPGILFCAYIVFLVMFKFRERMTKLRIIRNDAYVRVGETLSPTKHIGKLYWRMYASSMYPISCFVTLFPCLIAMVLLDSGVKPQFWFIFLFRLCLRLPGITNFFFMLYDPNFQLVVKEAFLVLSMKFRQRNKEDERFELEVQKRSGSRIKEEVCYDQLCPDEDWKIEFDDGFKMTLQEHIKYL